MTSTTSTDTTNNNKPFPLKARVILHSLKAADFNDKIGVIQQSVLNSEGRQQVFVEDLNKTVALKLANLKYQPREIESLSNKELKTILRHKQTVLKFQGFDKSDLQAKLKELTTDPIQIAEWLAIGNAGSTSGVSGSDANDNTSTSNTSNTTMPGLDQLDQMSPEMLRQQAQMMKSMPPATIRAMNPQLAGMSDAQIRQAAAQMEMMAANPAAIQQMKNQMKNMTPQQKQQYQQMMQNTSGNTTNPTPTPNTNTGTTRMPTQQEMLANMTPEQLRQQAQMMRSMPPDTIRAMNPQLANMTDAQIQQAASQFEMMASNPELMKMATEQMKNMTPQQMQQMMNESGGSANDPNSLNPMMMGANTNTDNNGAGVAMDPAKMLETMDTAQIKSMMKMIKENPQMLEQMAAQSGTTKESLQKMMDMFSNMSDDQLESSLKTMAKVQKVSSTVQNAWKSTDQLVGGKLKLILITVGVLLVLFGTLYLLGGSPEDSATTNAAQEATKKIIEAAEAVPQVTPQQTHERVVESLEDEFSEL